MKLKILPLTLLILLGLASSYPALADVEYYHCEEGIDRYWKFDTDRLDSVSPDGGPGAIWSMWSGITSYPIASYDKDWFKVVIAPSLGLTFFINRVGKPSLYRSDSGTTSLGVCKRLEESKEMLGRFLTESDKQKSVEESSLPVQNWN